MDGVQLFVLFMTAINHQKIAGSLSSIFCQLWQIKWRFHLVEPHGHLNGASAPYLCQDILWRVNLQHLQVGENAAPNLFLAMFIPQPIFLCFQIFTKNYQC